MIKKHGMLLINKKLDKSFICHLTDFFFNQNPLLAFRWYFGIKDIYYTSLLGWIIDSSLHDFSLLTFHW